MAEKKFDNDKILSPEQQENFDKYMKEYEEQNGLLMNTYNEDSKIVKIFKNKPIMLGLAGLLFVGCFAGLVMSFNKIDKQNAQEIKPPVVAQQPTTSAPTTQPSEQEITQEERIAKEEAERDLNEIKNNFKPFEGQQEDNLSSQNNSIEEQMRQNEIYNGTTQVSEVIVPPDHHYSQPATAIPVNPTYHPDTQMQNGQQPQQQEVLSLKGTSVDKYGNKIAYINDGTSTGTFSEGDVIGSFHVVSINKNNVVVEDNSSGDRLYLNR